MFQLIYDVLVYLTNNYSSLPDSFKKRFQEEFLIRARLQINRARLQIGSIVEFTKDWSDYE